MGDVATAKPNTVGAEFIDGLTFGKDGTDFYVKIEEHTERYRMPYQETTGDGDTSPVHEGSGMLYLSFACKGFMLANQAFGLKHLIDSSKNPVEFTAKASGSRNFPMKVLLYQVNFNTKRNAAVVGVSISGIGTGMDMANLEAEGV